MDLNELTLKEKLLQDMKQSMKEKDTVRKDVIQIVRAGILQLEKDLKTELDDSSVMEVISKEIKKRYDVFPDYERSGRTDLIDNINRQIDILKSYLPEQLTEDEINQFIDEAMKETGAQTMKDMGRVMQAVAPHVKGKADNKLVSEIVKRKLNL